MHCSESFWRPQMTFLWCLTAWVDLFILKQCEDFQTDQGSGPPSSCTASHLQPEVNRCLSPGSAERNIYLCLFNQSLQCLRVNHQADVVPKNDKRTSGFCLPQASNSRSGQRGWGWLSSASWKWKRCWVFLLILRLLVPHVRSLEACRPRYLKAETILTGTPWIKYCYTLVHRPVHQFFHILLVQRLFAGLTSMWVHSRRFRVYLFRVGVEKMSSSQVHNMDCTFRWTEVRKSCFPTWRLNQQ